MAETFNILTSADDGYCLLDQSSYTNVSTSNRVGNTSTQGIHNFFRFDNITIPAGAEITSAILRFTAQSNGSGTTCNANIHFEDADDPVAPTSGADIVGRSLTSAIAWSSIGSWTDGTIYDTPELKTILQDIIDRPGWVSGQAVIVNLVDNNSTNGAFRTSSSYDFLGGSEKELLIVSYSKTGSIDEGAGISDAIDAFNLSDELQEGAGISDSIDAFNTSGWIDEGAGSADAIDATKEISGGIAEGAGSADAVDANPEWSKGFAEGAGISNAIDAFNYGQWLRANKDKAIERYFFTLTGSADSTIDIEIPIITFQARKRTGESTYLSVTIKDYSAWADAITARSNGEMVIDLGYEIDGEIVLREEILRAELEDIRLDLGPRNRSIGLTGHKTQTFATQISTIENPTYKNVSSGRITYRFAQCDPYLNPGDTCKVGDDSFTVDHIVYMVSPQFKTMEVRET